MEKINLLQKYNIKNTNPRKKIIDVIVFLGKRHFSAEDVLNNLLQKRSTASRASVYRAIKLFAKSGLLREIDLGQGFHIYELAENTSHHDHIYCLRCGKIIEFKDDAIETLQKKVCTKKSFYPVSHTLRIAGICNTCRGKRGKNKS